MTTLTSETEENNISDESLNKKWSSMLSHIIDHNSLTEEETRWAMQQIMEGKVHPSQIAGFIVGLRVKGETGEEISGFAQAMLDAAIPIDINQKTLDIVGTGGDGHNTANISTMASIVASAAGVPVAKHGNRAASSKAGSADVLEALGVNLNLSQEEVISSLNNHNITFFFAKAFHPALAHAAPVRQELKIPTIFNILGPLTNPAKPEANAIGVSRSKTLQQLSHVLAKRNSHSLIFLGPDNLDELAPAGINYINEIYHNKISSHTLTAEDLNLEPIDLKYLEGGDLNMNKDIVLEVFGLKEQADLNNLEWKEKIKAIKTTVALNAAAGLVAFDERPDFIDQPLSERFKNKYEIALETINSQKAEQKLAEWINSHQK